MQEPMNNREEETIASVNTFTCTILSNTLSGPKNIRKKCLATYVRLNKRNELCDPRPGIWTMCRCPKLSTLAGPSVHIVGF